DRVLQTSLAVGDLKAALLEQLPCLAAETDGDDRVVRAVRDVGGHAPLRARVELPAAHHRTEAAHHQQPGRPWAARTPGHRAGCRGPLAEATDHRPPPGNVATAELVVQEAAEDAEHVDERLLIGVADLADHIPVAAARWHVGERRTGTHPEEAALGVQLV